MDSFFAHGGNFFDTARVYADWLPGGHGASEKTLGAWIKGRKLRDKAVISSKGARISPGELRSDLEESLEALETDYIDIYFLHRDNASRPVEEILETLETFKKEGKILYYGCSNWTLARMKEADTVAVHRGLEGFICDQIQFSLGDLAVAEISDKTLVPMDRDIYSWHEKTGKAVMAYTSYCNGWFSKKLLGKSISPGQEAVYNNEPNRQLLEKLRIWENELGVSAAVLVFSFVMNQIFPSVPIASFSSIGQLEELMPAAGFSFPPEALKAVWEIKKFIV
jgi:aryl-alcohol dehydrogenase-like predicted oxidoreductase